MATVHNVIDVHTNIKSTIIVRPTNRYKKHKKRESAGIQS